MKQAKLLLIPELSVSSLERSLAFYRDLLGFRVLYDRPENRFAMMELDGIQIMLEELHPTAWITAELNHPFGRGVNFQIDVLDVEAMYHRLKSASYPLFHEMKTTEYRVDDGLKSQKEFLVQDPDGYLLRFCQ